MELLSEVWVWLTDPAQWSGRNGIPARTLEHLVLSLLATGIAIAVALPPALWLAHRRKGEVLANAVVNIGRAVPSFGIIVVAALLFLRWGWPVEFWAVVVALVALALPPIFTNAYTGIRSVEPSIVESGRGMGFTDSQILRGLELPIAAPIVLAGIRIAFVQVIATVALGAIVGPGGGLGRYIVDGFALGPAGHARVFAGAILVALLTILAERGFTLAERAALPPGIARLLGSVDEPAPEAA